MMKWKLFQSKKVFITLINFFIFPTYFYILLFRYMKGRLTSLNVNVVIDSINVALENKYSILKKPRNALKKKDQDLYNTWKIQQNSVGQGMNYLLLIVFSDPLFS